MVALVGLSVSAGASGRSIPVNGRAIDSVLNLSSSVPWAGTIRWRGHGVCGVVRVTALDAYSRGWKGRCSLGRLYARDRVVDFGKNKGSMLATLSSRCGWACVGTGTSGGWRKV